MGVLRQTPPGSPVLILGARQASADTVCALHLAPRMDGGKPPAAAVSATECEAYDAMRSNLAARVRNEAALSRTDEAAHVLQDRPGHSFDVAVAVAQRAGVPLAEVFSRNARLAEVHKEDQRLAQSELERIGRREFTPEEETWHGMVEKNAHLTAESPMVLHAARELGANMMRMRIDALQKRAMPCGADAELSTADLVKAAQEQQLPKGAGWNQRLGTAIGERLHARAACGSMASPALAERELAPALAGAFVESEGKPLLSLVALARVAERKLVRKKQDESGPARRAEVQRAIDVLWAGGVLSPAPADPDPSAEPERLIAAAPTTRRELAESLRDIEWLWTQQRLNASLRLRADPLGDLVQTLHSGMWHTTERVDWIAAVAVFGSLEREDNDQPAYPGIWPFRENPEGAFRRLFGVEDNTDAKRGSVLLRRMRLDPERDAEAVQEHVPKVRDLLLEIGLGAYAHDKDIGPRQYGAYATPAGSGPMERFEVDGADIEAKLDTQLSQVLSEVVVLSEAWDGHCDNLHQEQLLTAEFRDLFVNLLYQTARSGIFHGDARRASVLFQMDKKTRGLSKLALTNFDGFHVKFAPMHLPKPWGDGKVCMAVVMLMCFLADVRCQRNAWVGPQLASALATVLLPALAQKFKDKQNVSEEAFLEGALHEPTLRALCANKLLRRDPGDQASEDEALAALKECVQNFLGRGENGAPSVPSLGAHADHPKLAGFRASRIPGAAARMVAFAASGADVWARQRRTGRRGKAP